MPVSPDPLNSGDIPPTPEDAAAGARCEACGATLNASARFCEYCGAATFLPLSTWSGVKNLDAHLKTALSAGADRDQVVCGAVQDCFDLIAADESAHGGKIGFHKLHRVIPDAVFEIATNLEWLPWEKHELTDVRIQDWLNSLFDGRIDHFESLDSGRPSGREYARPNPVVVPIPEIRGDDESSAPHRRATAAHQAHPRPDGRPADPAPHATELSSDTPDAEQVRGNIRSIRQAEQADPELRRKRDRRTADLNAVYARHLGRNGPEVQRQESLLKDARAWAKEESRTIIDAGVREVEELKSRVVKRTWDEFVRVHAFHSDLQLGYQQFASALWEEGWPSLNDFATGAIQHRAASNASASRSVRGPGHAAPIQARPPTRHEIKTLADDTFAVTRDRLLIEQAEKQNQILAQVRQTGNSGGYVPALTKWGAERLREMILALADAYVEAFTLFGVPSDAQAERDIEAVAKQMAAGSISGIRGQLDLMEKRTNRPRSHSGGHVNREIEAAMQSALKEGKLRLKRQRIRVNNLAAPQDTGHSGPGTLKHSAREAGPSLHGFREGEIANVPELPPKFQNRFETARAKAELEALADANAFPHHPQFAAMRLYEPIRIQKVFFAYCTEARNACREGDWTAMRVRQAIDAAWPSICDSYFVREHGTASDAQRLTHRGALWPTVTDDQRWKQHLSELVALAEGASTDSPIVTGRNGDQASVTTADAPGTSTKESDLEATSTLAPDAETSVATERDRLLRAFKSKGKTQGIKITHEMVAHAADANWNDRTMVTWWKRNDARCKPPHDKKIRAVLDKDPSVIWPKTS